MTLQQQFNQMTNEFTHTDEKGKSCTSFEYYFTLLMQSEFHDVSIDETQSFLLDFSNLIINEELQEQGLIFLCNQLWMSSRYFYEYKDVFIVIFDNFLQLVKDKFTLSLIFKSLPYSWGNDSTNNIINDLLNTPKTDTNIIDWFMKMDEDIYFSLNSFVELKDYIIVDLDNFYSQIFVGKCLDTIDY